MISFTQQQSLIEDLPYELVERKGVGHPDTMCDAIAERISRYYALHCLKEFGGVAHHWFDKVTIYGGGADIDFGRGDLTSPYRVAVYGKAAFAVGNVAIPVEGILREAASDVLSEVTSGFVPDRHLVVESRVVDHHGAGRGRSRYQPESVNDLVPLHANGLVSNDTNLLHGYAPFSRLEKVVLDLERSINGSAFKIRHPDSGWDVKVFGSRRNDQFSLIVNMPFLAGQINDLDHYWEREAQVEEELTTLVRNSGIEEFKLVLNPQTDRNGRAYLTALGSVADTGDVGVVGRGNRVNGLITPMRPMSIEAPAGKNPLDHTGKIYNVLAMRLAEQLHAHTDEPTQVHIFTSKEAPLLQPDELIISSLVEDTDGLRKIAMDNVERCGDLTAELIFQGIALW